MLTEYETEIFAKQDAYLNSQTGYWSAVFHGEIDPYSEDRVWWKTILYFLFFPVYLFIFLPGKILFTIARGSILYFWKKRPLTRAIVKVVFVYAFFEFWIAEGILFTALYLAYLGYRYVEAWVYVRTGDYRGVLSYWLGAPINGCAFPEMTLSHALMDIKKFKRYRFKKNFPENVLKAVFYTGAFIGIVAISNYFHDKKQAELMAMPCLQRFENFRDLCVIKTEPIFEGGSYLKEELFVKRADRIEKIVFDGEELPRSKIVEILE